MTDAPVTLPSVPDKNVLYYGDNLDVMRRYVRDESVDLVYLDPPFNSNATYNVLFAEHGTLSAAQIKAFEDTWRWDESAARAFEETVEQGGQVAQAMIAFRTLIGRSDMLAYLSMMAPRLEELHRVLKPTGTLYLHCDPTASHYLKLLMDAVFRPQNFRNEIIWCYAGGGIPKHDFPRKHDTILRYTKTNQYFYTPVFRPYSSGTVKRGRTAIKGKYFDAGLRKEGTPVNDWWVDVGKITSPTDPEKLGYPTQKSEALLERILAASSREGDLILDPFCGCGTTVAVAQRLGRRWLGIDITHLAINLIRHRLLDTYGETITKSYSVIGEPTTVEDAKQLAREDPYQFQWWALGLVGARPTEQKKGADKGIDGRIFFHDEAAGKTKQVILSVKAGKTQVSHVRDLRGVIQREEAEIGVLISFQEPTKPMREEAASADFYPSPGWGTSHPRLQLLTVAELLDGKEIDYPHMTGKTFKKAAKHVPQEPEPDTLFDPTDPSPPASVADDAGGDRLSASEAQAAYSEEDESQRIFDAYAVAFGGVEAVVNDMVGLAESWDCACSPELALELLQGWIDSGVLTETDHHNLRDELKAYLFDVFVENGDDPDTSDEVS